MVASQYTWMSVPEWGGTLAREIARIDLWGRVVNRRPIVGVVQSGGRPLVGLDVGKGAHGVFTSYELVNAGRGCSVV